jgi:hypothetical protein
MLAILDFRLRIDTHVTAWVGFLFIISSHPHRCHDRLTSNTEFSAPRSCGKPGRRISQGRKHRIAAAIGFGFESGSLHGQYWI